MSKPFDACRKIQDGVPGSGVLCRHDDVVYVVSASTYACRAYLDTIAPHVAGHKVRHELGLGVAGDNVFKRRDLFLPFHMAQKKDLRASVSEHCTQ